MRKNANTYNCLPAIIDANVMFLLSAKAFIGSKGEKIDAQLKTLIMCKSSSCVPRIEIDSLFYKGLHYYLCLQNELENLAKIHILLIKDNLE